MNLPPSQSYQHGSQNGTDHRAAPMTPTIFEDRIAAPVHAVILSVFEHTVRPSHLLTRFHRTWRGVSSNHGWQKLELGRFRGNDMIGKPEKYPWVRSAIRGP
jgi:hypothetical protein